MIICKKYKQQIVIQLYENHCPNTVYLKGTGLDGQYKNIHLHQLYILRLSPSLLHYNVTLQLNLISIFNFLRNHSRRPHLQNKGNMTSKKLRSWQIKTKSLMAKGVSSSLLLLLQNIEYILCWINKVWIKFSSRRLLIKWN